MVKLINVTTYIPLFIKDTWCLERLVISGSSDKSQRIGHSPSVIARSSLLEELHLEPSLDPKQKLSNIRRGDYHLLEELHLETSLDPKQKSSTIRRGDYQLVEEITEHTKDPDKSATSSRRYFRAFLDFPPWLGIVLFSCWDPDCYCSRRRHALLYYSSNTYWCHLYWSSFFSELQWTT